MTPQERANLQPCDKVQGAVSSKDPFVAGLGPHGLVVQREPNKVLVRWEDGEECWYVLDDPGLLKVHYVGSSEPGDPPWLPPKAMKRKPRRR
jgi:hypothetical protein